MTGALVVGLLVLAVGAWLYAHRWPELRWPRVVLVLAVLAVLLLLLTSC